MSAPRGEMMKRRAVTVALLAVLVPSWWSETNSHATNRRGIAAWGREQYEAAAEAFRRAAQKNPSAAGSFNVGTAETATGDLEAGAQHLTAAASDGSLKANAHYNAGTGALAGGDLERAVEQFVEALRTNPAHSAAKRNLEIALAQQERKQRDRGEGESEGEGDSEEPKQPVPSEGDQQPEGEMDLDALLRSVLQQEQEELRRMKSRPGQRPTGW